ncbi:hypothetical protein MBAV_002248 [Candidatus Magnetobacterium bavaricum]|uniref:Uncharacterized protein n=1 Tax=Candidatus Magnetobacterium bavaricum TaxID=29290 RepID=A0A0F3GUA6_9BACT|nr:hypothetical protein MBAV_002248 [Candidatus Magnetobacterium bavaricum]
MPIPPATTISLSPAPTAGKPLPSGPISSRTLPGVQLPRMAVNLPLSFIMKYSKPSL